MSQIPDTISSHGEPMNVRATTPRPVASRQFLAALALLAGFASEPHKTIDTTNSAKIRVFHGAAVYMFPGKTCYDSSTPEGPEKIHAAAGGFSMMVANKKVGMPVTEDIPRSYHEYVIPADQPLTLEMYWALQAGASFSRCGPVGATFTPEVGKYYDTSMQFASGYCAVRLRELIDTSPGKASAHIKATTPAASCTNK